MVFDLDLIKKVYDEMPSKIAAAKKLTGKALTLSEKILYTHLYSKTIKTLYTRKRLCGFCTRPCCHAGCHRSNGPVAIQYLRPGTGGRSFHRSLRSPDSGKNRSQI